jgi:hypothetical protein
MELTISGENWANLWRTRHDIPLSATHVSPKLVDVALPGSGAAPPDGSHLGIFSAQKQSKARPELDEIDCMARAPGMRTATARQFAGRRVIAQ